jgi:hypothetical protein
MTTQKLINAALRELRSIASGLTGCELAQFIVEQVQELSKKRFIINKYEKALKVIQSGNVGDEVDIVYERTKLIQKVAYALIIYECADCLLDELGFSKIERPTSFSVERELDLVGLVKRIGNLHNSGTLMNDIGQMTCKLNEKSIEELKESETSIRETGALAFLVAHCCRTILRRLDAEFDFE